MEIMMKRRNLKTLETGNADRISENVTPRHLPKHIPMNNISEIISECMSNSLKDGVEISNDGSLDGSPIDKFSKNSQSIIVTLLNLLMLSPFGDAFSSIQASR